MVVPARWLADDVAAPTPDAALLEKICLSGNNAATFSENSPPTLNLHASFSDSDDRAMPMEVWDNLSDEDWEKIRSRVEREYKTMLAEDGELVTPITLRKVVADDRPGSVMIYGFRPIKLGGGTEIVVQRWELADRGAGKNGADRILHFCFAYPVADSQLGLKATEEMMSSVAIEKLQ